jgi:hypothetical protein
MDEISLTFLNITTRKSPANLPEKGPADGVVAGPSSFAYVSKYHNPQTARKFARKRACGGGSHTYM